MKTVAVVVLLLAGSYIAQAQFNIANRITPCTNDPDSCKDKSLMCSTLKQLCQNVMVLEFCKETCGACTMCCTNDCADHNELCNEMPNPAITCSDPIMGESSRRQCPRKCGVCRPCNSVGQRVAPSVTCTKDCRDNHPDCGNWKKLGFCKRKDAWLQKNCRYTCNECVYCPDGPTEKELQAQIEATRPTTTTPLPTTTTTTQSTVQSKPAAMPSTTNPPATTLPTENPIGFQCIRNKRAGQSPKEQCKAAHEYYRCLHGADPLAVDNADLEQMAEEFADFTTGQSLKNPLEENDNEIGINIAASSTPGFSVDDAVVQWYSEGLGFLYNDVLMDETNGFTQLIWRQTEYVSCAERKSGSETYIVALYKLKGNELVSVSSNVLPPIVEACEQFLEYDICQSHDVTGACSYKILPDQIDFAVSCTGQCVVFCEQPFDYDGYDWKHACEGEKLCTCDASGSSGAPGALCE